MEESENLTVMFTDIVDFSRKTQSLTRKQHRTFLADHDELLIPLVKYYRGNLVKSVGDGMMIAFRSPTDALKCAMAMHDRLFEYNKGRDQLTQIIIRVALNVGDVHIEKQDIFGSAVNLAARVESITPAGDIYFSQAVHLAINQAEVDSERVGKKSFKGFDTEVDIYRVVPRFQDGSAAPFGVDFTVLGDPSDIHSDKPKDDVGQKPGKRGIVFGWALGMTAIGLIGVLGYLVFSGKSIQVKLEGKPSLASPNTSNLPMNSASPTATEDNVVNKSVIGDSVIQNSATDGVVNAPPPPEAPPPPAAPPPRLQVSDTQLASDLSGEALKVRIKQLFLDNKIDGARNLLPRFQEIAPKEPDNDLYIGHLLGIDGQWPEAIRAYEKAINARPGLIRDRFLNESLLANKVKHNDIALFLDKYLGE